MISSTKKRPTSRLPIRRPCMSTSAATTVSTAPLSTALLSSPGLMSIELEVLLELPVGNVVAEAGELVAAHRAVGSHELVPEQRDSPLVGLERLERLLRRVRQGRPGGVFLGRRLRRRLELQAVLDPKQPGGEQAR